MKKLHLLCNAHLDPVWLWRKQEGMAEAISTFRVAAQLCEEFDGFIFNHNEALLYEWVEEYEPELFQKIRKLVKEGKWHIMGGWYLQPDCLIPCGESFIRQIEAGNSYFMEKFGVKPRTAINFDPFGHSRGLVQILKKCGYDSYIYGRPGAFGNNPPEFIWKGYDGSEIIAHCPYGGYNSGKGNAVGKIDAIAGGASEGNTLILWGIGDHGGGPSRLDLERISQYASEHPEYEIVHSWAERYMDSIDKSKLNTVDASLVHCMVGCYTTMSRIKKTHRLMENELAVCEKMLAISGIDYDRQLLANAEKTMLLCEFHDILPGTMIKVSEDDSLRVMSCGREIIEKNCEKAFFKLCEGQKVAKDGEIPILVFNPSPYPEEKEIEVEFQLADQNWTPYEVTLCRVKDEDGNYLPTQNEKEASSIRLDWRKKIVFRAPLKPMSMNRFDCELHTVQADRRPIEPLRETDTHFIMKNDIRELKINKTTGLIDLYNVNGMDYLTENGMRITVYKDNEDPWGMTVDRFTSIIGEFIAVSDEEANSFCGYPNEKYKNVRVIENGEVRTKLQVILKHEDTFAVLIYSVPKHGADVDIKLKLLSNNTDRMYKLTFDTRLENPDFLGQSVFGREKLLTDSREVTYQKWCGLFADNRCFAVLNKGTYGGSAEGSTMNISVMRTPVYSAHPISGDITYHDRLNDHIDMGERDFEYRLTVFSEGIDAKAESYNQPVRALSFFPSGSGDKRDTAISLSNTDMVLTRFMKKADGSYLIRVYNTADREIEGTLDVFGNKCSLALAPHEVNTYRLMDNILSEISMIEIV